jgi:glycosyltransferase involved in cell wall biosynthesis
MESERPGVSLFFPVYKDERTVRTVTEKAIGILEEIAGDFEILIIDDGSPDRSGEIADELAAEYAFVRAVHHGENRGYGEALKTGLRLSRHEWICFTDGDDEYDVRDLANLLRLRDYYDLIITFRYVRLYSGFRIFVSRVYNMLVRLIFQTPFRDISTGLRLVRKSVIEGIDLHSSSPFIGAEIAIKVMLMGFRIGEVGIQTFPRSFGRGMTVTPSNIVATLRDLLAVYRGIFSDTYRLPPGRSRMD